MEPNTLSSALNTIAQCAAALAALIGFFGLWRLERLQERMKAADRAVDALVGVAGAIAGKFTLSGIAEKALLSVIPIFASRNNAFEACCCMCQWGHDCTTHQQTRQGRVF